MQVREIFGRTVYSHKTHEKCAEQFLAWHSRLNNAQIVLSAILTGSLLLAVFGDSRPATITGAVIEQCSAWRELVVTEITTAGDELPRSRVTARVIASGSGTQPPMGICRARHAAVEASIVASRLRWLGADEVSAELDRLQELVDKTAGPREREAMAFVRGYVAQRS